jgi:hypothetical protein
VESGNKGKIGLNIHQTQTAPTPSPADLEKKYAIAKIEDDNKKVEGDKNEDEPIRINYNDIHKIEDILLQINQQPGHRKVVLEHAPNNSGSATTEKQHTSVSSPLHPTGTNENDTSPTSTTNENDDSSAPPKSILKTSQDPSSMGTSTKTSSFQNDQIHVNIEGIQSVDDLLDRVDDAVQNVPVIIETKHVEEKRQGLLIIIQ